MLKAKMGGGGQLRNTTAIFYHRLRLVGLLMDSERGRGEEFPRTALTAHLGILVDLHVVVQRGLNVEAAWAVRTLEGFLLLRIERCFQAE